MICILIKKASKLFDAHKIELGGFAMFLNIFFSLVIFGGAKSERSLLQTEKL